MRPAELIRRSGVPKATVFRHLAAETSPNMEDREKYAGAFTMPFSDFESYWQADLDDDPAPAQGALSTIVDKSESGVTLSPMGDKNNPSSQIVDPLEIRIRVDASVKRWLEETAAAKGTSVADVAAMLFGAAVSTAQEQERKSSPPKPKDKRVGQGRARKTG